MWQKHPTVEIFSKAGHAVHYVGFGGFINNMWATLHQEYPEKIDPSKLEVERLNKDECVQKFLHSFQRRWRKETERPWNDNITTDNLFKLMVKESMPWPVQKCLGSVVGLMTIDWPLITEHIVNQVEKK